MSRLLVAAALLITAACTEPKARHLLEGTWKGSASPSSGSTISVSLTLLPDGTGATGFGSFTTTAGPTGNPIFSSITAVVTHTDSVTMALSGTGVSPAFFEGRVQGETMGGTVSGSVFGFPGTHIVLIRQE